MHKSSEHADTDKLTEDSLYIYSMPTPPAHAEEHSHPTQWRLHPVSRYSNTAMKYWTFLSRCIYTWFCVKAVSMCLPLSLGCKCISLYATLQMLLKEIFFGNKYAASNAVKNRIGPLRNKTKTRRFFFFLLFYLFSMDSLNWSKVTVKTFILLQKTSI